MVAKGQVRPVELPLVTQRRKARGRHRKKRIAPGHNAWLWGWAVMLNPFAPCIFRPHPRLNGGDLVGGQGAVVRETSSRAFEFMIPGGLPRGAEIERMGAVILRKADIRLALQLAIHIELE